jgi:glutamyl-tRNA reductase
MHLSVVGLSHKTAPVEYRERLAVGPERQEEALTAILATGDVLEAVILSTCNRTEIYACTTEEDAGRAAIGAFLSDFFAVDVEELAQHLYWHEGTEMVRHLYRVISSLDSMILGEAQILGQVKEAFAFAFDFGATATAFNKLFRSAIEVGKRVRTETDIGASAVSVSYAAVELARKIFSSIEGRTVLIVGAGKMSELTAKNLVGCGVKNVLVTNRTFEKAEQLAEKFGGKAIEWEDFRDSLKDADIVISSTAATHHVIDREMVSRAMKARRNRPVFMIDIAVPRDVDPEVGQLYNVFLYDVDDLQSVVEANLAEREREATKCEALIEHEVRAFADWLRSREVVPTIAALQAKAERIRVAELERAMSKLGDLSDRDRRVVETLASGIINKMLHDPMVRLRESSRREDDYQYLDSLRHLFGLDQPEDEEEEGIAPGAQGDEPSALQEPVGAPGDLARDGRG